MNLQVEGDDTNAELVEDIPSGQTLAAMLQHLLRMVYKDSLTGKESEDFVIDGASNSFFLNICYVLPRRQKSKETTLLFPLLLYQDPRLSWAD
jgi:hypothetical protein